MATLGLKIRSIGNSLGFTLPKELTEKMHVGAGDVVYFSDSPEGYRLTPYDPEFERQMEKAESLMRRYRNALHQLAK